MNWEPVSGAVIRHGNFSGRCRWFEEFFGWWIWQLDSSIHSGLKQVKLHSRRITCFSMMIWSRFSHFDPEQNGPAKSTSLSKWCFVRGRLLQEAWFTSVNYDSLPLIVSNWFEIWWGYFSRWESTAFVYSSSFCWARTFPEFLGCFGDLDAHHWHYRFTSAVRQPKFLESEQLDGRRMLAEFTGTAEGSVSLSMVPVIRLYFWSNYRDITPQLHDVSWCIISNPAHFRVYKTLWNRVTI